jgi:hypothetical protein
MASPLRRELAKLIAGRSPRRSALGDSLSSNPGLLTPGKMLASVAGRCDLYL